MSESGQLACRAALVDVTLAESVVAAELKAAVDARVEDRGGMDDGSATRGAPVEPHASSAKLTVSTEQPVKMRRVRRCRIPAAISLRTAQIFARAARARASQLT